MENTHCVSNTSRNKDNFLVRKQWILWAFEIKCLFCFLYLLGLACVEGQTNYRNVDQKIELAGATCKRRIINHGCINGKQPHWRCVAKGSCISWVAKLKGDKNSEWKLSNGWSQSHREIKPPLSAEKGVVAKSQGDDHVTLLPMDFWTPPRFLKGKTALQHWKSCVAEKWRFQAPMFRLRRLGPADHSFRNHYINHLIM